MLVCPSLSLHTKCGWDALKPEMAHWNDKIIAFFFAAYNSKDNAKVALASPDNWGHKTFRIFHFLQSDIALGIANPFSWIINVTDQLPDFNAFPINVHWLHQHTKVFQHAKYWLLNWNFRCSSRMQARYQLRHQAWNGSRQPSSQGLFPILPRTQDKERPWERGWAQDRKKILNLKND